MKTRALLVAAVASLGSARCLAQRVATPAERAQWLTDSARYVADSIKYVHDRRVRDSISRMVNTDSLYKLTRARLTAADPVPIEGERECEEARLAMRFGAVPANMAMQRMEDTVWKRGEEAAVRKMEDRLHNMTVAQMASIGVSQAKCGKITPMLKEFDGARLDALPAAPVKPKRPGPTDSLAIAQEAAQNFLEWYAAEAVADSKVSGYWTVLTVNEFLDDELASALRADSVARANFRSGTRDLLDMDPFLGGQDYCKLPPRTTGARREGKTFVVSALTCVQSESQTGGPSVGLRLLPIGGQWRITNVIFGSRMNLKSYLCKLAQTDVDRAKRPAQCPP